jgi:aminocarboxymuconate-semialdehyde decarboxylase
MKALQGHVGDFAVYGDDYDTSDGTAIRDERELKHLIEIWGADHIMLGTDYPFDMAEPDPVGFLSRVKGVSDKDMALVAGGNAARLLGLPARV